MRKRVRTPSLFALGLPFLFAFGAAFAQDTSPPSEPEIDEASIRQYHCFYLPLRWSTVDTPTSRVDYVKGIAYAKGPSVQVFRLLYWAADSDPCIRKELVRQYLTNKETLPEEETLKGDLEKLLPGRTAEALVTRMQEVDAAYELLLSDSPHEDLVEPVHIEDSHIPALECLSEDLLFRGSLDARHMALSNAIEETGPGIEITNEEGLPILTLLWLAEPDQTFRRVLRDGIVKCLSRDERLRGLSLDHRLEEFTRDARAERIQECMEVPRQWATQEGWVMLTEAEYVREYLPVSPRLAPIHQMTSDPEVAAELASLIRKHDYRNNPDAQRTNFTTGAPGRSGELEELYDFAIGHQNDTAALAAKLHMGFLGLHHSDSVPSEYAHSLLEEVEQQGRGTWQSTMAAAFVASGDTNWWTHQWSWRRKKPLLQKACAAFEAALPVIAELKESPEPLQTALLERWADRFINDSPSDLYFTFKNQLAHAYLDLCEWDKARACFRSLQAEYADTDAETYAEAGLRMVDRFEKQSKDEASSGSQSP